MRVRWLAGFLSALTLLAANEAVAQRRHHDAGAADTGAATSAAPTDPTAASGAPASGAPMDTGDAAAPTADVSTVVTGEQYVVRLRDLEQRINELKEEIFRSKARLSLLAESVLQNVVGGARAVITHENEMGSQFRLIRAVYALDGAPILTRTDDNGSLGDQHQFPVYNGQIGAGDHTITVNLEYQGNGFGIFSYVKGYTFRVRSTESFSVPDGKAIQLRVVAYEKGGPMTPPEERPAVRYIPRIVSLRDIADDQGDNSSSGSPSGSSSAPAPGSTGGTTQPQGGGAGNAP